MIDKLKQPFPFIPFKTVLKRGALIGSFVFLFLSIFQPFGMQGIVEDAIKLYIFAGFGIITFISVIVLGGFGRLIFPNHYKESKWTLGKEVFHVMINFLIIGACNFWYSVFVFNFEVNFLTFLSFEAITLLIGGIPFSIIALMQYTRLLKENLSKASSFNYQLQEHHNETDFKEITIQSDLKEESLTLNSNQLIYASSADNYIEVYYLNNEVLAPKKVLRLTLKNFEEQAVNFKPWVRCHRGFFVNLNHVKDFTGNAQGLKLRLKHIDEQIPVSRKYVNSVKNHLG